MSRKLDYEYFKSLILPIVKSALIERAFSFIAKVFGTTLTGFKGWVAKIIVEQLYEHVAVPVTQLVIRKGLLIYDTVDGHFKIKRINKARDAGDEKDYLDNISDI